MEKTNRNMIFDREIERIKNKMKNSNSKDEFDRLESCLTYLKLGKEDREISTMDDISTYVSFSKVIYYIDLIRSDARGEIDAFRELARIDPFNTSKEDVDIKIFEIFVYRYLIGKDYKLTIEMFKVLRILDYLAFISKGMNIDNSMECILDSLMEDCRDFGDSDLEEVILRAKRNTYEFAVEVLSNIMKHKNKVKCLALYMVNFSYYIGILNDLLTDRVNMSFKEISLKHNSFGEEIERKVHSFVVVLENALMNGNSIEEIINYINNYVKKLFLLDLCDDELESLIEDSYYSLCKFAVSRY